jgi:hypothetical protein
MVNSIKTFFIIIAGLGLIGAIATGITSLVTEPDLRYINGDDNRRKEIEKSANYKAFLIRLWKKFCIAGISALTIGIVLPNSNAVIGITAAQIVTKNNVIMAGDTVCDIKDAIKGE